MQEQDEQNVKVLTVDIQMRKPSAEAGKDPSKYTPSKPMFLQKKLQKHEALLKKNVSCSKSKSNILKKKRPKDKFQLFKLDRLILGQTIQIPQLGKSVKCLKKKDKLAAIAQMSGSQVFGKEKTSYVGRTDRIPNYSKFGECQSLKPLEYTFDILCSTDNVSLPPLVKESDDTNEPFVNALLTMSSSSQEIMPVPKAVTNGMLVGDLIDLGTPKIFKPKVDRSDRQLSVLPMDKIGELDDVLLSNLNPLLINLVEPCCLDAQAPMQTHIINEVENFGSGVLANQSARNTALAMDDHNYSTCSNSGSELDNQCQSSHSELSHVLNNTNRLDERDTSPQVFYGFPGLNSPMEEKQQRLISNSPQTLVHHLNKDPFPKAVRENTKVRVRRRAFSMDDSLIAVLPCRPGEEAVDLGCLSVDKAETILNEEASCPQNSESNSSSQISNEPAESSKDSSLMVNESDCADHWNHEQRCSNSNEIVPSDLQYSEDTTSESNLDCSIEKYKSGMCSSNMSPAAANQSIPENESDPIFLSELPNVNIINENSIGSIPEHFIDSSSNAEEYISVPDFIEGSSEVSDYNPQAEDQSSLLTNDSTHIEKVFESLVETQISKPSTENVIEESASGGISFLQQQVPPDSVNTMGSRSQCFELVLTDGVFNRSEMGLHVNSNVNECDHRGIPTQNILDQTPIPSSFDQKELSECSAPDPQVSLQTNPSKLDVDDTIDDMSGKLTSNFDSTVSNSPSKSQETEITSDPGLSFPEKCYNYNKEPYLEEDLGQSSCTTVVDIPAGVDHNTGIIEDYEGDTAETSSKPTEEIVPPNGVTFDDSDNDSIFGDQRCMTPLEHWVLPPGKKYRRSLSIIRNLDEHPSADARRGRHYEKSVEEIIRLQGNNVEGWTPVQSLRQRLSMRRSSWMRQITPPPVRRNTFIWSPTIPNRGTLFDSPLPRKSIYSTPMQHNLVRRMSARASPMQGPRRSMHSSISRDCAPASPVQYTIKDLILTICKQTQPCSFSDILNEESYAGGCKLGEGVFGEVFSISREGQNTVLKIIPIEGQQLVNGEKQKTYQEVLSELVIAKVLDELRYEGSDEFNQTSGYAQLIATSLVQGCYPETLLRFWEEFDQTKGSDNENPKLFVDEQLFIVMEQGNGGKDVESYTFSSAKQSLSVLKQLAFSLAVAEISVEFEHRDLHWGNVLVSKTTEKQIFYTLNGNQYSVASNGVKCTVIDYTLSRIKYINQVPIYNDIGKDPEMFIATGDYQFDIYRFMKKDVEDDWARFAPKTNARWLHYLLDKMLTKVKYQRKTAKVHKDSFKALEEIGTWIEDCGSALSIALRLAESKH